MNTQAQPLLSNTPPESFLARWFFPLVMLLSAYSLLFLTFTSQIAENDARIRCVLMDDKMARIWSVGNIEIGAAYLGVFLSMVFYFLRLYRTSATHLRDLMYALAYLVGSFILDLICVRTFEPFIAMFIGDAIVMTFTVIVSRQLWFQRLLGVFVPIIFLTCGIGHFLEGLSYWQQTYPINVPWTMVTADIGFAVLVNSSRFPAFIRGEDILTELAFEKERTGRLEEEIRARKVVEDENAHLLAQLQDASEQQRSFLYNVLYSVTEGRLQLCFNASDLPKPHGESLFATPLTAATLKELRVAIRQIANTLEFSSERSHDLVIAAHEAAMNAVVHANGGTTTVYTFDSVIQVWVTDAGKGIAVEHLPKATLERGYSSVGTLGQGFWLILKTADRVWLWTSPSGTTVVIEQDRAASEEHSITYQ